MTAHRHIMDEAPWLLADPDYTAAVARLYAHQHARHQEGREMDTRTAHMAWAKQRALAYCQAGDLHEAFASLLSDLGKHPETKDHRGIELGMTLALAGHLRTVQQMQTFIEGLN